MQGADPPNRERPPDIAILPRAVDLTCPVRASDPVLQVAGDLEHSETGPENVDGETNLDSPTMGQR
jgi:hypothetical protein